MPLYKADPNDSTKQIPDNPIQGSQYSKATCPTNEIVSKRPTYVIINKKGTYAFSYENTPTTYITGSSLNGDDDRGNASPRLDIQPTAWRKTDATGAVGDVTFVYVRVS